jgi:4-amino-4-deoxy-L-arabinose transferase-like glycosyltransferase
MISFNAGESAIVALQFEIRMPVQRLATEASIAPGAAAKAAGKSVSCGGRWIKAPRMYAYTCIVAGGQQTIASGPIVELQLEPASDVKRESYKISVERILAIDSAGNHRRLKNVEAAVAALH